MLIRVSKIQFVEARDIVGLTAREDTDGRPVMPSIYIRIRNVDDMSVYQENFVGNNIDICTYMSALKEAITRECDITEFLGGVSS